MPLVLKLSYKFNAYSSKIPKFKKKFGRLLLKFIWTCKGLIKKIQYILEEVEFFDSTRFKDQQGKQNFFNKLLR